MKTIVFIAFSSWLLLLSAKAQQISLVASTGTWHPWIAYEDPYGSRYQRFQAAAGLGFGMDFRLNQHYAFAPELGLQAFGHHYDYNNHTDVTQFVNLVLMYACVSPGVRFWLAPKLDLRAALSALIFCGGTGSYELTWIDYDVNVQVRQIHQNRFSEIARFGNLGPELSLGYKVPLRKGGIITPRLSSFVGLLPTFKYSRRAPFSPRLLVFNFEVAYTFPSKNHEN